MTQENLQDQFLAGLASLQKLVAEQQSELGQLKLALSKANLIALESAAEATGGATSSESTGSTTFKPSSSNDNFEGVEYHFPNGQNSSKPISSAPNYFNGSFLVESSQNIPASTTFPAYSPVVILQRNVHGGSSLLESVLESGTGSQLEADPDNPGKEKVVIKSDVKITPAVPGALYVENIAQVYPGQLVDLKKGDSSQTTARVTALGWDERRVADGAISTTDDTLYLNGEPLPYLVTDASSELAEAARLVQNKTNLGVLTLTSEDHCANQASVLAIQKYAYGPGDAFGNIVLLRYLSNIYSTEGDEGGNGFAADLIQEVNPLQARVVSFDYDPANPSGLAKLTYAANPDKPAGSNSYDLHADHLATGLPIINLNKDKWITGGSVQVFETTTYAERYGSPELGALTQDGVVVNADGPTWPPEVVGRYFAVVDLADNKEDHSHPEYLMLNNNGLIVNDNVRYRWYRIANLWTDPKTGKQLLFVWRGDHEGSPDLLHAENYAINKAGPNLSYIIAPGAEVCNVSQGLHDDETQVTIWVQPNGDCVRNKDFLFQGEIRDQNGNLINQGDPIEQAIASSPWNPTGFRVRHFTNFPSLRNSDQSFYSTNLGTAAVKVGLYLDGQNTFQGSQERYHNSQGVAYCTGINFGATMQTGIAFNAEVTTGLDFKYPLKDPSGIYGGIGLKFSGKIEPPQGYPDWPAGQALYLEQGTGGKPEDRKALVWTDAANRKHFLGVDPESGEFYTQVVDPVAGVQLPQILVQMAATGANRINLSQGAISALVTGQSFVDSDYRVVVMPSWDTGITVTERNSNGFTINFIVPAPVLAKVYWFVAY